MKTIVFLSGVPTRADVDAAPFGIYDVIREDLRRFSTVQPVDRSFIERTDAGYRGVLYSKEQPYMFALNGNGFVAKPLDNEPSVISYCAKLEEDERSMTGQFDARRADDEQSEFNDEFAIGSPDEPSMTATTEDAPPETLAIAPAPMIDFVERIPDTFRQMRQGAPHSAQKENKGVCGGGIAVNKEGKILLVKPKNGYGGYDWTIPKGYPKSDEKHTAATAAREVCEETGYRVFAKRFIGRFHHNDGGVCDYYECDLDGSKPAGEPCPVETEEVRWVSLVEAMELLNDDVDVKIVATANSLIPQMLIKGAHSGTMVALHLPKAIAEKLAIKGGEPAKSMHITLAYLGKGLSESQKKAAATLVRSFATRGNGIKVTLGGVGRFSASETSDGKDVVYLSVDSPVLTKARQALVEMLEDAGLPVSHAHGFVPHVTLAYVDKDAKTPIERFEPLELTFDAISLTIADKQLSFPLKLSGLAKQLYEAGRRNYEALMLGKALPRLSDEQREEKNKKVGAKPLKASSKQVGSGGKVRYSYPGEKGGDKQQQGADGAPQAPQDPAAKKRAEIAELPHPDLQPPQPDQAPIAAEHPEKPPAHDVREADPTKPATPKHTINVAELCAALNVNRAVLQQIAVRLGDRNKFVSFMRVHVKQFAQEHGLDGDYFGLLFDVLTGKVPEGQPASAQQAELAKKPKPVA